MSKLPNIKVSETTHNTVTFCLNRGQWKTVGWNLLRKAANQDDSVLGLKYKDLLAVALQQHGKRSTIISPEQFVKIWQSGRLSEDDQNQFGKRLGWTKGFVSCGVGIDGTAYFYVHGGTETARKDIDDDLCQQFEAQFESVVACLIK